MDGHRAWSLISIAEGRQYSGNLGYKDEVARSYQYDSRVPNHRQLAPGDIVFIRSAELLLGVARIERISAQKNATKQEQRCPQCASTRIRSRQTREIQWKCDKCKAEFKEPALGVALVTRFIAHYSKTFKAAPKGIAASVLKAAALRPNDQVAIEEVDLAALRLKLAASFPVVEQLITGPVLQLTLQPEEAAEGDEKDVAPGDYEPWDGDQRQLVLRAIRIRRGQSGFRNTLIKTYGASCMVSGCGLLDLVEAAHIRPFRGAADHHVENGLLLRADLHTLFDLDLMTIHPETLEVLFSDLAKNAGYLDLHRKALRLNGSIARPSKAALESRWNARSER